jgi:hypothetical protein
MSPREAPLTVLLAPASAPAFSRPLPRHRRRGRRMPSLMVALKIGNIGNIVDSQRFNWQHGGNKSTTCCRISADRERVRLARRVWRPAEHIFARRCGARRPAQRPGPPPPSCGATSRSRSSRRRNQYTGNILRFSVLFVVGRTGRGAALSRHGAEIN